MGSSRNFFCTPVVIALALWLPCSAGFIETNACDATSSFDDQVSVELRRWTINGHVPQISQEEVNHASRIHPFTKIFQILDGQLYVTPMVDGDSPYKRIFEIQCKAIEKMVSAMLKANVAGKFPNVEIIVNCMDEPRVLKWESWPIFSIQRSQAHNDVLIPDWYFDLTGWLRGGPDVTGQFAHEPAWSGKVSRLLWRGSTTGGRYVHGNWRSHPRGSFVARYKHSTVVDARLTAYKQSDNFTTGEMSSEVPLSPKLTMEDHWHYKYLLVVDGNGIASRMKHFLASYSTVFRQESPFFEFWYPRLLKKYHHYVPVKEDLSDLEEKVAWCNERQNQCQTIAARARASVRKHLTKERILCYLQKLFASFALLLAYSPQLRDSAKRSVE